jgi:protein SCO1/2
MREASTVAERRQLTPDQLRTISRLSVVAMVAILAVIIGVKAVFVNVNGAPLVGDDLGGIPAPAFQLKDQDGATVSLIQFRGQPVVLAFLYTHCPDVCPLTAEKMHTTATQLGTAASKVAWIAVSVDPTGDTPDAAKQFVATHGLTGRLQFLLGSREALAPVWADYHLAATSDATPATGAAPHTGGVYLIDKQGRERVYLASGFRPETLAQDLTTLINHG